MVESEGTKCGRFITIPSRQLSVRAEESQGFGRCRAGRGHKRSDDVVQACQWDGDAKLGAGRKEGLALVGVKGGVGITLRGYGGRGQWNCADDVGGHQNVEENCVCWNRCLRGKV